VIKLQDLINQAQTANYLTPEEIANTEKVDPLKLQQVFARCTNEILVSIIVPLKREKLAFKN